MARWHPVRTRHEPPGWYRSFDPAMWDEPDGQELQMLGGLPPSGELHAYHAERRWHEAQYAYRQEHPAFASQELADLFERRRKRQAGG